MVATSSMAKCNDNNRRPHYLVTTTVRAFLISVIISCSSYYLCNADLNFLQVPNFCNGCLQNGCLNEGNCRSDDGRCDCQRGFWGNRCQYRSHGMYKFGQCPSVEVLGNNAFDWPQLQPDSCHDDADCPGLWKCCPSFVETEGHADHYVQTGTSSCTQPYLEAPLVPQLPLCLQHLWNVTDSGRTFSGCDLLMCDESTGGRTFDRWQCNYCEANASTCFCFISFDNEGKYWGELPGSRKKVDAIGEKATNPPKHDCSLQDRCPQMFPHSIYCTHGIQRDPSGCPTGDCLSNPEEKCFTPCSAGFVCEHRPEPEQVNHWHCIDTFRQFRVAVPISTRLASAISNDLSNVSAKAAELVALHAIVDESVFALVNISSILPCGKESALIATTAATANLLPLQNNPSITVIEIVGQVAFSANFSGVLVRRHLQEWLNETYGARLSISGKPGRTSHAKLSTATIAVISTACVVSFLAVAVGIPLIIYRRRLFTSSKFSFESSQTSHGVNSVQAINIISSNEDGSVFSAFSNQNHRYGTSSPSSSSPSADSQHGHQMDTVVVNKVKTRPAPLPPTTVTPLPEMSSSTSSSSEDGSVSPNTPPVKGKDDITSTTNESFQAF